MATYYDPVADANEAADALRGLAHASRSFTHPQDLYEVLRDLLASIRSLDQVLDQLSHEYVAHQSRAFDDFGDHSVGAQDALFVADELHQTATLLGQAESRINEAAEAAAQISWRAKNAEPQAETVQRWVSVCFLQGEDADEVLQMIDDEGIDAAVSYLKGWDYGEETTQAALENGHVYDYPPTGPLEQEVRDGRYEMIYSHSFGQVALYRSYEINVADAIVDEEARGFSQQRIRSSSFFEHPGVAAVKRSRGLGL